MHNWEYFIRLCLIFSHVFAQNIDCGYTLGPPGRVGSNEYSQSMFLNKKIKNVYACIPQFHYKRWILFHGHVFVI